MTPQWNTSESVKESQRRIGNLEKEELSIPS